MAFQQQLESEVPHLITDATSMIIPDRFDTVVTVLASIIVFCGAGVLKELVFGHGAAGAAKALFDGLISELASDVGKTESFIRDTLAERYAEKTMWRRVTDVASSF